MRSKPPDSLLHLMSSGFAFAECGKIEYGNDLVTYQLPLIKHRADGWGLPVETVEAYVVWEENQHRLLRGAIPLMQIYSLTVINNGYLANVGDPTLSPFVAKSLILFNEILKMRISRAVEPLIEAQACFSFETMPYDSAFGTENDFEGLRKKVIEVKLADPKVQEVHEFLKRIFQITGRSYIASAALHYALNYQINLESHDWGLNVLSLPVDADYRLRFWQVVDGILKLNGRRPIMNMDVVSAIDDENYQSMLLLPKAESNQIESFMRFVEKLASVICAYSELQVHDPKDVELYSPTFHVFTRLDKALLKSEGTKAPRTTWTGYEEDDGFTLVYNPNIEKKIFSNCIFDLTSSNIIQSILHREEPRCVFCDLDLCGKLAESCVSKPLLARSKLLFQEQKDLEYLHQVWSDLDTEKN